MAASRAPKQWCLSKLETVNSFENWRQNLLYTLSLDANFAPFLVNGAVWGKQSKATPHRGLISDGEEVLEARRKTREQKVAMLELMLGQIANYCPVISRSTIVKGSTSIDGIWQTIRLHFGFQSTGAHFIDFASIKLEHNERPEDLYQRIMAFSEDNLLRTESGLTHHDQQVTEDEELTPSLENFLVLTWLRLIHSDLPKLVKQRYGTELRSRTLASIKPEVSQALDSLLEELHTSEDARSMRAAVLPSTPKYSSTPKPKFTNQSGRNRVCPLCKAANRPHNHFLSKCVYLPPTDRKYLAKARAISGTDDTYCDSDRDSNANESEDEQPSIPVNRVQIRQSPYIDAFYQHHAVRLTIDSGATGNMIKFSVAQRLHAKITKTTQSAHQADGLSPLHVVGETRFDLKHGKHELYFEGLVVDNLETEILAGIPFMERNDITIRPSKHQVILADGTSYNYSMRDTGNSQHRVRRAQVLRSTSQTTVWPGEFVELKLPDEFQQVDDVFSIEPKYPDAGSAAREWPSPSLVSSVSGRVRIPNLTSSPQTLKRNEHICMVRTTLPPTEEASSYIPQVEKPSEPQSPRQFSAAVQLDPDKILPGDIRDKFHSTIQEFDHVFDPNFPGYNGAVGPFEACVNMGPVQPPQRKGRVPQYSKNQLVQLQEKFDEMESIGVFRKPEDIDIHVEYVNPSFLVKKPNGDYRLVTAFADVGRYSKPQPSLMPDVDSTLRQIAQWKYLAVTDLTKSFYQIPLARESMKYCGVVTPFRGVRVYARCAMGMPGSETALEELTCRVLGDLVQEGFVAKVADDLYCGGNTPEELLLNFRKVLQALDKCNLHLSASKTIIAPKQATVLGWIWRAGTLQASPHRIATLSTCEPPTTVSALRSFVGAYKVLARVVRSAASLLSPLDDVTAGRESKDRIIWTEDLQTSFKEAQGALQSNKSITLPRQDDNLWIVTDGALRKCGLGSTLYVTRGNKTLLAGFFSAKVRKNQTLWLPCEIEALSIAAAIKHFAPYIIQSSATCCVLTDSKPCVQAYEKLCRGEFSASPRVSTFLSTASRYQLTIRHVSGSSILPSDFASRNAAECDEPTCQICQFVNTVESSVVREVSIQEVLNGNEKLPFTSRAAWLAIQSECPDLRRTHAHLKQGTRPSKKITNIKDVKRYLNVASISRDGLLVVKRNVPFAPNQDSIVVPRSVLDGLLMSLHIRLDHPSGYQLKNVINRFFYALDMDRAVARVSDGCHTCASLRKVPRFQQEQSSCDPPETVGVSFAADVMKRERQLILVVRECVTSFTLTSLLEDEKKETLRNALLQACVELRPLDGPHTVIRTDSAPGFAALRSDELLDRQRITIECGRVKNKNKNPVAEKAIQEVEEEILHQDRTCRAVSPLLLSLATARLNSRIRSRGLSAREMLLQRDQFSNVQIPLEDQNLILNQHKARMSNHGSSQMSKAPGAPLPESPCISIGDLVYLYCDRDKSSARNRYLVVSCEGSWCNIRKFVGSQLRSTSYRVKMSDCYKVPSFRGSPEPMSSDYPHPSYVEEEFDSESDQSLHPIPAVSAVPDTPEVISQPPDPIVPDPSMECIHQETCDDPGESDCDPNETTTQLRRSTRKRCTPQRLGDYELY